jgi:transcriptional regulator with XRE-family HTH domain
MKIAQKADVGLSRRLRDLRRSHRWLLEEAAVRIGVSSNYLHRLERGRFFNPSMQVLLNIADTYNVTLDFLCGRTREHPPN